MISNTPLLAAPLGIGLGRSLRVAHTGLLVALLALLFTALAPSAQAGFIDQFPLSDFTLVNSPNSQLNNGFVTMSGDSIVLTGGNSGSGEPGTTDLTTTVMTAQVVEFLYSYFSLDIPNADDAGYLINGSLFPLAVASGASGIVTLSLTAGEVFGFQVGSADNQFEPGVLTISSVTTPEPATGSLFVLLAGLALGASFLRRSRNLNLTTLRLTVKRGA